MSGLDKAKSLISLDDAIDLGLDHYAVPTTQSGAEEATTGYMIVHPAPVPDVDHWGPWCAGGVTVRGYGRDGHAEWDRPSEDPLTLTPSVLCSCGDHGFVTNGQWVRA